MRLRELSQKGIGDLKLHAQAWLPDAAPRAVVVIAHGLGEHGGRYGELANALRDDGRAVYVLDHRGHGRSEGPRGNVERFAHLVSDFCTFAGYAAREHPDAPVVLLGHSMGGAIALAAAARLQNSVRGLVLSAPALAPPEAVPPLRLLTLRVMSVLAPNRGVLAIPPAAVSRDRNVVRAYESDPLVLHGPAPARTVAELLKAMDAFPALAPQVKLPVLIQHGTADSLVPVDATRELYKAIGGRDRAIRYYEGLFHEIYNEPERLQVIADLRQWLDRHTDH